MVLEAPVQLLSWRCDGPGCAVRLGCSGAAAAEKEASRAAVSGALIGGACLMMGPRLVISTAARGTLATSLEGGGTVNRKRIMINTHV